MLATSNYKHNYYYCNTTQTRTDKIRHKLHGASNSPALSEWRAVMQAKTKC